MRIVTDYWDYYDSVQQWASDSKDVYIRRRKEVKNIEEGREHLHTASTNIGWVEVPKPSYYSLDVRVVGFCGKLYPLKLKCNKKLQNKKFDRGFGHRDVTEDCDIDKDYDIIYGVDNIITLEKWEKSSYTNYLNQLLSSNVLLNIFKEKKVPLFVATKRHNKNYDNLGQMGETFKIDYAPMLYKYRFDEIFDAYQAFQEIEMYFANVIYDRENPDPQITDSVVLRDAKGFNNKSFKHRK